MTNKTMARRIGSIAVAALLAAIMVFAAATSATARPLGREDTVTTSQPAAQVPSADDKREARTQAAQEQREAKAAAAAKVQADKAKAQAAKVQAAEDKREARTQAAQNESAAKAAAAAKATPGPVHHDFDKNDTFPGEVLLEHDEPQTGRRSTDPKPAPKPKDEPQAGRRSTDPKPGEHLAKKPAAPPTTKPAHDEPASGARSTDPKPGEHLAKKPAAPPTTKPAPSADPSKFLRDQAECYPIVFSGGNEVDPVKVRSCMRRAKPVADAICKASTLLPFEALTPLHLGCLVYDSSNMFIRAKRCHDGDTSACEEEACEILLMTMVRLGCPEDFPRGHPVPSRPRL
jgi:hypothetical protein